MSEISSYLVYIIAAIILLGIIVTILLAHTNFIDQVITLVTTGWSQSRIFW